MHLSVLGFGRGAVGELMVRGNPLDQERTHRKRYCCRHQLL